MEDEELDLSAWAAPPAPSGLADRVIARVNATDAIAVAAHHRRRTKRVWWLAGGLVAVVAGVAIAFVAVLAGSPEPHRAPPAGAIVANRPQQLALPGAIANLDPGTDVAWQTSGATLHVQQRSGAATWRVDEPHLFLDVGAAVASIEASNATLRVETKMNLSDVRVVGAAALTSAAVALVTVSVYEGQAKLSSAGQTVVVQPGTTYAVLPGKAPMTQLDAVDRVVGELDDVVGELDAAGTPRVVADAPELVVPIGEKITIHDPQGRIRLAVDTKCPTDAALLWIGKGHEPLTKGSYKFSHTCAGIDHHGAIEILEDAGTNVVIDPKPGTHWADHVSVLGTVPPARAQVTVDGIPVPPSNQKYWLADVTPKHKGVIAVRIDGGLDDIHYYIRRETAPPSHDATASTIAEKIAHGLKQGPLSGDAIDATMKAIEPALVKCIEKRSDGQLLRLDTNPDGTVGHVAVSIDDPVSNACVVNVVRHTRFPKASGATSIHYSLAPPCDPDRLIEAGNAAVARGAHDAGLKSYEAALDCKYDDHTMELSFMAACSAGNVAAARRHWKTMTSDMKTHFLQICLHAHITQEQLDE